jgi:hypothetical protein
MTLFSTLVGASAATYTVDIDYDLLDGQISPTYPYGGTQFETPYIPIDLPTLATGDVIDTTINFTRGLALTISDPNPVPGLTQKITLSIYPINLFYFTNVLTHSEMSLLHATGDIQSSEFVANWLCNCVVGGASQNFTDSSFSFRGFEIITTILDMPSPFASDKMSFYVYPGGTGDVQITHGGSLNPIPLPAALPLSPPAWAH